MKIHPATRQATPAAATPTPAVVWPPVGVDLTTDLRAAELDRTNVVCDPKLAAQVVPFVKAMAYRAGAPKPHLAFLARHVEHHVNAYSTPLDQTLLFTYKAVEDTLGNSGVWTTSASLATARWALRKHGRVLSPVGWPAKVKTVPQTRSQRYTPMEVRALMARARKLEPDYQRTRMLGILLLGLGAGLDGKDIPSVRGTDVRVGEHAVFVEVRTPGRERSVPVLQQFEHELVRLAVEVGETPFVGVSQTGHDNYLTNFTARMNKEKGVEPRANGSRLRATWLSLIASTASLAAVARATGIKDLAGWGNLITAAPTLTDKEYAKQLRGCRCAASLPVVGEQQ